MNPEPDCIVEKYVKKILASRVYDVALETPLQPAPNLSQRLGCQISFKREDTQPVFSFKIRGAYNKIAQLSEEERSRGVIAASAGNHAQGVAYSARQLGIRSLIVMGRNTPSIKLDAVRRLGAKVVLHGDTYPDAAQHAKELVEQEGFVFCHPFDDVDVIAGQGTVGMEIVNQHHGPPEAIFVPVGGGGLVAGIAAYVKYLWPQTRVIGVEAEGSACLAAALETGRRVKLPFETLDLFADGVSVAQVGQETFKVARRAVDGVIKVNTDEICAAVKDVFDDTRALPEPSGALAIAGLKKYVAAGSLEAAGVVNPALAGEPLARNGERRLVAIVSGANVNFDRLRHISERAEVGEHREVVLAVTIPERKGSFRSFCRKLGKRAVSEFNYRYAGGDEAHVYVGLQTSSGDERPEIVAALQNAGYAVADMTDNEAAKLHVRHMVGGRRNGGGSELLYRFEFPERPGALLRFLSVLGANWNITLFHYRNHGAAWGRVLVGFQAAPADRSALGAYLERVGYRYWEETDNPAYGLFLR